MCWNNFRICEIPCSQAQSANDAFIMSATTPPERHNPKAWANYGCKGSELFWIEQENSDFFAKFSLEDTLFGAAI